jgi:FAD-dependent urate hydroxylase
MVFIGDAGHAMSPQLGQGTNLALVDAMVLADCLDGATDLPAALARYSRERRAHIAHYELAAHALMPLFQSAMPGMGMLRDTLFTVLSRLPWVDGQMIRTMAGIKRGIIRPSMTLDLPLPLPPPGA